jgi:mannose-1-phosphate guanylyltransferase
MLQMTVTRLLSHFSLDDIYIATNAQYQEEIITQLPTLDINHIILEPEKRDTAPAIGYSSILVNAREDESIVFLASDHYIHKPQMLCSILYDADTFLHNNPEYIVTLGITPTHPETGYGYIQYHQNPLMSIEESEIYPVNAFVEKPQLAVAEQYISEGNYVWNSGMFIVKKNTLLRMYKEFLPQSYTVLQQISSKDLNRAEIHHLYAQMDKISFDYGIMEKYPNIAVIPSDIGWSDIGSWASLKTLLETNDTTVTHTGSSYHLDIDSSDILVHSHTPDKIIATIGIRDIVIVETHDALLVSHIDKVQEVKSIVSQLAEAQLQDNI